MFFEQRGFLRPVRLLASGMYNAKPHSCQSKNIRAGNLNLPRHHPAFNMGPYLPWVNAVSNANSVIPMMPFMGVRMSWLMLDNP
jgi:hypothetical protein